MSLLDTAQRSIFGVFNALPVVLMTVLLVLGFGLGNHGIVWVLGGQVVLYPAIAAIHFVLRLLKIGDIGNIPYSDTVVLVPGSNYSTINVLPSMWITQVSYFFSYVFLNALDIYNSEPVSTEDSYEMKVNNRKTRTIMIMTWAVIFGLILISCRWLAGSEKGNLSILITISSTILSLGVGVAYAWTVNMLGKQPNIGRTQNMDIFGITQQMMLIPKTSQVTVCATAGSNR